MAKEQKRTITPYMGYMIDELEKLGFYPRPVPEEKFHHSKYGDYIIMEAYDKNGNALSTIVLNLREEAKLPKTREHFEERLQRQQNYFAPKVKEMKAIEKEEMKAAIQVKNQLLGLQDVPALATKYKRAKTAEATKAARAAVKATESRELGRK